MSPSLLSRGLLVRHQLTRAPPRHTASSLVMMSSSSSTSSQADVVIAGGGMVGSAAAAAIGKLGKHKLALLWGEAQKKIAYSYLKMTLCYPNVNYSGLKVTYS